MEWYNSNDCGGWSEKLQRSTEVTMITRNVCIQPQSQNDSTGGDYYLPVGHDISLKVK